MDGVVANRGAAPLPGNWLRERDAYARGTLAAASRAIGARAGIIKQVSDRLVEPDDPRVFHAVTSLTNTARLYGTTASAGTGNSGVGLTRDLAMASAIGETIERYCCAIYDGQSLVRASYGDLTRAGLNAVAPGAFALYAESQYRRPGFIHHPLTEGAVVNWTWGYSLIHGAPVLVPACLVYVPYRYEDPGDLIAFGVTTGLCCARSRPEALLGGLYEVIERDAIIIMWMNRLPCPRISPSSGSWLPRVFQERFAPCNLRVSLNDITTDLPIPVVFALLIDEDNDGLAVVAGASAHFDPQAAALKALLEAAQGRRWLKLMHERSGPRHYRDDFGDVVSFDDHVRLFGSLQSLAYVDFLAARPEERDVLSLASLGATGTEADLQRCLDLLAANGMDAIAVEVTQPDVAELGFRVMKVLVPGLVDINADHNYPFLGGERLYTVPHKLGFVDHVVQEIELNPIPHPFP